MFSPITKIIKEAKKGKMFILVDDENRENEGDLIVPAKKIKVKDIIFMAKYGRGLICLSLDSKKVKKLNLQLMSPINQSRSNTAFTVSIDAAKNITTGISAHDRAYTIKSAIKKLKNVNVKIDGLIFNDLDTSKASYYGYYQYGGYYSKYKSYS